MRRFGLVINTVLCTVLGVVAGWIGVRFIATHFDVLVRIPPLSWVPNDDVSQWLVGIAILFVARAFVAGIVSVVSAYGFAHRWPVLGKWTFPVVVSAALSIIISLIWAAYEFVT
jgi:hypothetical protein